MRTLRQAAVFLVTIDLAAFALILLSPAVSPAGTPVYVLTRAGGITLLALFFAYLVYIVWDRRKFPPGPEELAHELGPAEAASAGRGLGALVFWFAAGLVLVIGGSEVVVGSARNLATALSIPRTVISLTIVAIGTSVPEIATCVAAARKGEGALAVGDIVGADILNIAWVAGASATVNPLAIARPEILFMFPAMLVIVGTMLTGLFLAGRMTRALGVVLVTEYVVYMTLMATYFV
jgi:cation:H+ antiporter